MSYIRVIPRDLFNEANLLKCMGRTYINLETANLPHVELHHDGEAFDIVQSEDDGSLSVANVLLRVRESYYSLSRPLNSREAWPLYLTTANDVLSVFDDAGNFTDELIEFLRNS